MHHTMWLAWSRGLPALVLSAVLGITGCGGTLSSTQEPLTPSEPGHDAAAAYSLQTEPTDGVTYSGILTDSAGTPVSGADILTDGQLAAITQEDGSYAVTVERGTNTLDFALGDFVFHSVALDPATRTVQAQPGDPGAPSRGAVAGRVMDQHGPVADALVVFANRSGFFKWAVSGPEGHYELGLVPAGPGILGATARMHEVEIQQVIVRQNALDTFPIFLAKFPPMGHLVGVVLDDDSTRDDPQPLAGARVTLFRKGFAARRVTVRTNHNGAYFIGAIPAGDYVMVVRKEGYCPRVREVQIDRGRNFRNVKLADADPTSPCGEGLPPGWPGDEGPGGGLGDDDGGN